MRSWRNPTESERTAGPQEQVAADSEQSIVDKFAERGMATPFDAGYGGGMLVSRELIVHSWVGLYVWL